MSFESISPNMSLPVPGVGLTDGPQWAVDVNDCFDLIDAHDHSPGQGVQITASGININTDFSINDNNLTDVRSIRFAIQASPLALPTDLGCLYESGVDLYYNDGNGNAIRITQSGSVVGTPGSITGLTSPASATYVAGNGTFVWQQAVNTAANMDMASAIIRKDTASSAGITIAAPVALSADYTTTLPAAPPSVNSYLAMDASGNISSAQPVAPNYSVSASSGTFISAGSGPVTNLSVNITTSGRPVCIVLESAGAGSPSGVGSGGIAPLLFDLIFYRGVTVIGRNSYGINPQPSGGYFFGAPGLVSFDPVAAGTYTYSVEVNGSDIHVRNLKLVAYEI